MRWGILLSILGMGAVCLRGERTWSDLDPFQGQHTAAELVSQLTDIYAPQSDWSQWVTIDAAAGVAWIRTDREAPNAFYRLELAPEGAAPEAAPRFPSKPLAQWRIAIDPGHLGGPWGPLEHRSFSVNGGPVVQEGDLVLAAGRHLKARLEEIGAEVVMLRDSSEPVTDDRPDDFLLDAFQAYARDFDRVPERAQVQARAASLFYRRSEILARGKRVNEVIRPDLVIALHIDAAAWPDPEAPQLVSANAGHVLVNGSYMDGELADDEDRLELFWRLLSRYDAVEGPIARSVAAEMVAQTGLEPALYTGRNATILPGETHVFSRNLLANRIYQAPVVYLEPWTLNSEAVYPWAAMGDYEGVQIVAGAPRASLPAVYADFVFRGILAAFETAR